jgi:hypothetical protein
VPAVVAAGEEWAGQGTVPVAQGPDLGWAVVEWVGAEAPEAQGAARVPVVAVADQAAEVCGNPAAACLAAEVELEDPEVAQEEPVAPAEEAGIPGVAGEQVPVADQAAEVGSGAVVAAAQSPVVDQAADRVAVEGLAESGDLEVGLVRAAEVAGLGEEPAAV